MRSLWIFVLGAVLVVAAGCTNSESLDSGAAHVPVRVEVENGDTRFPTRAFLRIRSMRILPVDPLADAVHGATDPPAPLLLLSDDTAVSIDLNGDPPFFVSGAPLPVGFYKITRITIDSFDFLNGLPANDGTCPGSITNFPFVPNAVSFTFPAADQHVFEVQAGAENTVTAVIDGQAFLEALEESFSCRSGPLTVRCRTLSPPCTPTTWSSQVNTPALLPFFNTFLSFR
ncbi:MAG TPA: hypothetical protein VD788_09405 [Candidatus Polarisedimenticolaceae bacterium]|nr:hypothetical protein [Candidatus Polarisedimenticolaceae bacterium]